MDDLTNNHDIEECNIDDGIQHEFVHLANHELQIGGKAANEWTLVDICSISFKTVDEAQMFYNRYALEVGFSIRKDKIKIEGDKVKMRSFVCSKAGFRRQTTADNGEASNSVQRPRYVTRCGCSASFKVRISSEDNMYHPVEFNHIHNHRLATNKLSYLLRSHRDVDEASAHQIAELRAAGIKPSQIMNVMVQNRGGYENVGFTRKDLFNHIHQSTSTTEVIHECELALQYIQGLARTDPGLYVRVDYDSDNRITKIFLSDTISRSDYAVFGDVIICDATYKTNHLRLPFALLVGVDNHCATVVYACVLLTDETKETYQWVFETFVSCMGRAPTLIITDGDKAMQWAIREVMPLTRHRLCYWHIIRRLGGVCQNNAFNHEMDVIMKKRFPEEVFWQKWWAMLEKYGVLARNPRWVHDMTETAKLWAETFFDGVFTAGLFSNQRAESTNSNLKKHVSVRMTVHKFFQKYFVFLDSVRQGAMINECINSQAQPANLEKRSFNSIRNQIAETYTLAVYEKLDKDIHASEDFRCHINNLVSDATCRRVTVEKYDPEHRSSKQFQLTCDRRNNFLICSCRKFEKTGLPCTHMFATMKQLGITKIANSNLTYRWMKDARKMCNLSSSCSQAVTSNGSRLATIRPHCQRLAHLSSLGDEHMAIAIKEIEQLSLRLGCLPVKDEVGGFSVSEKAMISDVRPMFGDPPVVRTKGAPSQRAGTTARCCSYCLQPGHSKPTCDQRRTDISNGIEDKGKKKKRSSQPIYL